MLAQAQIVKSPLMAPKGMRAMVEHFKGWSPADKFGAATFGLLCLLAVGSGIAYMRTDYTQINQSEVARLNATMEQRSKQRDEQMKQRDENIQSQMRDIQGQIRDVTNKLDQMPRPEAVQEIRRRMTEAEGRENILAAQLNSMSNILAAVEVRLQSLEKGSALPLPARR